VTLLPENHLNTTGEHLFVWAFPNEYHLNTTGKRLFVWAFPNEYHLNTASEHLFVYTYLGAVGERALCVTP
jgi:hypothetical protein